MKVNVDTAVCASHGQCVFAAPDVFDFDDEEELVYDPAPDPGLRAAVQRAALSCPVRAIAVDGGTG